MTAQDLRRELRRVDSELCELGQRAQRGELEVPGWLAFEQSVAKVRGALAAAAARATVQRRLRRAAKERVRFDPSSF